MIRISIVLILALAMFMSVGPSQALDLDMSEELKKIELAEKMHEFRPTHKQVNQAIDKIATRYPVQKRESFKLAMRRTLNYKAVEKISIDAMVETYSLKELEAMVEYYSKEEARSASEKYEDYASKVQPELIRMIDKAMMRVKAGEN